MYSNTFLKNLNKERDRLLKSDKENLEKIELNKIDDIVSAYDEMRKKSDDAMLDARAAGQSLYDVESKLKAIQSDIDDIEKMSKDIIQSAEDLGVILPDPVKTAISQTEAYRSKNSELASRAEKAADGIYSLL